MKDINNLISLQNIKKKYNEGYVLDNFNYVFKKNGLYLLFGHSGSGKTTLLNVICGLIPFNSGIITINGKQYNKRVNYHEISNLVSYVTQDTYFIDYLTVKENIYLTTNKDEKEVSETLKLFNVEHIVNQFPAQLSGGERQRIAIAIAVLQNKKILILDEITSALDRENKNIILSLLDELKKDFLIIACSHDEDFKVVTDEVIDFSNLHMYTNSSNLCPSKAIYSSVDKLKISNKRLFSAMMKGFREIYKNKIPIVFLVVIIVIVLLVGYLSGNEDKKILKSMVNTYNLNYLKVSCPISTGDFCLEYFESDGRIVDYSYLYEENLLDIETVGTSIESQKAVLPYDDALIPYENIVLYGEYFESDNQVILGYETATEFAKNRGISVEQLIGTDFRMTMSNGQQNFEIVGVLRPVDGDFYKYMVSGLGSTSGDFDYYVYLSNRYVEKYIDDGVLGENELSKYGFTDYYVYFNNKNDLISFYNEYKDLDNIRNGKMRVLNMEGAFIKEAHDYRALEIYLKPIAIISIVLASLFYFQTKRIDMMYKQHIFSTYEYYGFKTRDIKTNYILISLLEIIVLFVVSFTLSILSYNLLNYLNTFIKYITHDPFMMNLNNTLFIFLMLLSSSLIFSLIFLSSLKIKDWYQLLTDSRDVI